MLMTGIIGPYCPRRCFRLEMGVYWPHRFFHLFLVPVLFVVKGAWGLGQALVQLALPPGTATFIFRPPVGSGWGAISICSSLNWLCLWHCLFQHPPGQEPEGDRWACGFACRPALLVTIAYQVFILRQFDIFTLFDIASASFIAQWFWVLFLEWRASRYSKNSKPLPGAGFLIGVYCCHLPSATWGCQA